MIPASERKWGPNQRYQLLQLKSPCEKLRNKIPHENEYTPKMYIKTKMNIKRKIWISSPTNDVERGEETPTGESRLSAFGTGGAVSANN